MQATAGVLLMVLVTAVPPLGYVVKGLVDAEWTRYVRDGGVPSEPPPKGTMWSARVSPPFPIAWPPDGSGRVVYYAYAGGFKSGLADAEEIAAPWAKVSFAGIPKLERIGKRLRVIGTNGVHPISGEELTTARTADQAAEQLLALSRGKAETDAPVVKRFYCQWARDSGIGAEAKVLHSAFFTWLECSKKPSR